MNLDPKQKELLVHAKQIVRDSIFKNLSDEFEAYCAENQITGDQAIVLLHYATCLQKVISDIMDDKLFVKSPWDCVPNRTVDSHIPDEDVNII